MNIKIKYFLIGFLTAIVFAFVSIATLFYMGMPTSNAMIYHEQALPSGKKIKVTMCNFVWGVDHSDRYPDRDSFAVEYISSIPSASQEDKDKEAMEVFELIRPISEQWHIETAEIMAFPSVKRKGKYDIYEMQQSPSGKWEFTRRSQKVHIND